MDNRKFLDDADRLYTYNDIYAEWSSDDFSDIRAEWNNNFSAYLTECCGKNGALREV